MVRTGHVKISSRGDTDIIDITGACSDFLSGTGLSNGVLTVFCPGSTGGLTTLEHEPNLVKDLKDALEVIAPSGKRYAHGYTWNDDNGSSHVRSSFIGPSITVTFSGGKLDLGTWQQVVFCDFDTRPRDRELVLKAIGE